MLRIADEKALEKRIQDVPDALWATIAKIDELKGQWVAGVRLDPQTLGRLKQSVLITSTGASTRIEGAKLSDHEVERLMSGLDVRRFADRDEQEARGYFLLLQNVFAAWKAIRFSESAVKHFHKELLRFVAKDQRHRGEYKKVENSVGVVDSYGKVIRTLFATTPAYLTPKAMQELTDWTKSMLGSARYHPLLVIGNFLVEFLRIHPFQDGNGRLSRVLTNLLLLQSGYVYMPYVSHEKIVELNKTDYYLALRQSQKTFGTKRETIVPWLAFFLSVLHAQAMKANALLSQEHVELLLSEKQAAVLNVLLHVAYASRADIVRATKIPRATVNQALAKLLRLQKIERLGQGRATRYRVR